MKDRNGDEIDGYDEGARLRAMVVLTDGQLLTPYLCAVIFPMDYKTTSYIVDDVCFFDMEHQYAAH